MPEVEIHIGGRTFEVACQDGEQHFLQAAAKLLDDEAQVLTSQIGRIPEPRMLLMAGLMLADKTAGLEDKLREVEAQLAQVQGELQGLKDAGPEKVEVAVIPPEVTDTLAELAARAESLADTVEEKVG
ncbi:MULTISPECIES: cell division protein ZapA [Shimia]|uniref:cell division protein ZapA n=1 Tax=Shimia TaxID=573139 RepID=UPI001FB1E716|nr:MULTISPECIES: cell division protein ZapA [Shimia]MDV4145613.1 cell division protein ZapA [Shimia sp. FJ5]